MSYAQRNYLQPQGRVNPRTGAQPIYRIDQIGCFITTIANMFTERFNHPVDPIEINRALRDNGWYIDVDDGILDDIGWGHITLLDPTVVGVDHGYDSWPKSDNAIIKVYYQSKSNPWKDAAHTIPNMVTHFCLVSDHNGGIVIDPWDGVRKLNPYGTPVEWMSFEQHLPVAIQPVQPRVVVESVQLAPIVTPVIEPIGVTPPVEPVPVTQITVNTGTTENTTQPTPVVEYVPEVPVLPAPPLEIPWNDTYEDIPLARYRSKVSKVVVDFINPDDKTLWSYIHIKDVAKVRGKFKYGGKWYYRTLKSVNSKEPRWLGLPVDDMEFVELLDTSDDDIENLDMSLTNEVKELPQNLRKRLKTGLIAFAGWLSGIVERAGTKRKNKNKESK